MTEAKSKANRGTLATTTCIGRVRGSRDTSATTTRSAQDAYVPSIGGGFLDPCAQQGEADAPPAARRV